MTHATREQYEAEIAALGAQVAALERTLQERDEDNAVLKLKLAQLLHRLYGSRSEKLAPGQMSFLGELVEPPSPEDQPPDDEATREPRKRRRGHGRARPPKDLPRERVVHELSPEQRACPCCGEAMEPFGEDVSEELDFVPARLLVREHVRPKYACKGCQEGVAQAPMPPRPIEKGLPGPGLLAHVLVSKFVDHLPLARQSRIFARLGLELSRSTLCDWVAACVDELQLIVVEIRRAVLAAKVIQADETPLLVLEDHNGKRRRQCWLWVYRGSGGEVVYDFRETRARDGPRAFLAGFQGFLQRDGYQGYGGLPDSIVEVGCWAHARRHFYEARSSTPEARQALDLIGELYGVEDEAKDRGLPSAERAALRREKAEPVLGLLRRRLDAWHESALPKSDFGKAVAYARAQWPTLVRYVDDGDLAIDNNDVERALRGVALGRKNWLFAGSYAGARRVAAIYSLVESCKAEGVEPFAYFADVLTRTTTATARELTPRAWKAARAQAAAAGTLS